MAPGTQPHPHTATVRVSIFDLTFDRGATTPRWPAPPKPITDSWEGRRHARGEGQAQREVSR